MDNANETIDAAIEPDAAEDSPSTAEQTDAPGAEQHDDANTEAKNWRLKYRAAATRADIAEARVAEQNRKHAERVLAHRLADPSDAWTFGADLNTMLDDYGLVDDAAVLRYADELVAAKPHLAAKLRPVGAPASAVTSDDPIPSTDTALGWQEVISGKAANS